VAAPLPVLVTERIASSVQFSFSLLDLREGFVSVENLVQSMIESHSSGRSAALFLLLFELARTAMLSPFRYRHIGFFLLSL
jgi:hypothetical protein